MAIRKAPSWRKYPDQINLELIRVFLSDAKKKKHGLLLGAGKTGWRLTQAGLDWAEKETTYVNIESRQPTR
jgi:hypothetical protein